LGGMMKTAWDSMSEEEVKVERGGAWRGGGRVAYFK